MAGELVVREARPGDARAIAEVSVASRRWSYRDLLAEAELEALSVEKATAHFAQGLAELRPAPAVFVAERAGRLVGYAYVLPSPEADVPAGTSELGSLYVTEVVAGTGVARALMDAAIEHARAAGPRYEDPRALARRHLRVGSGLQFLQLALDQVFGVLRITFGKWSQSNSRTTLWDDHEVKPHQQEGLHRDVVDVSKGNGCRSSLTRDLGANELDTVPEDPQTLVTYGR